MDSTEFQKKLQHFFHSHTFHYILAGMIILDLIIVLFDLIVLNV